MSESAAPIPVIAQHESWISIDPVQGCPAGCVYCYLSPQGLARITPATFETPEAVYRKLLQCRFFNKSGVAGGSGVQSLPVCVGNYTDMCLTSANRDYLLALLNQHRLTVPGVPLCVVTKGVLDRAFLQAVSDSGVTVIFFISVGFLSREFERGTPSPEARMENFARVAEFADIKAVHFWRPLTSINLPSREAAETQVTSLKKAGAKASVMTGLKFGDRLAGLFKTDARHPLREYYLAHAGSGNLKNEILEPEIREAVLGAAREQGYPVYLHTSCALSYVLARPDYNATFRKTHLETACLPSNCQTAQRGLCFSFKRAVGSPASGILNRVAAYLDLPSESVRYSEELEIILVERVLTQEEQVFLTQATSFPVRGRGLLRTLEWVGSSNR